MTNLVTRSQPQYGLYQGIRIACISIVATACYGAAQAGPINGDFSAGLSNWQTIGDVDSQAGTALISDATGEYSALYQPVSVTTGGAYQLRFDFRPALSSNLPSDPFGFADTFFATLYMTDLSSGFDPLSITLGDDIPLLDADRTGSIAWTGKINADATLNGWFSYELDFSAARAWAIPTFELLSFNTVLNDSLVEIDNIVIKATAVPTPGTLALLLAALVAFAHRRRLSA